MANFDFEVGKNTYKILSNFTYQAIELLDLILQNGFKTQKFFKFEFHRACLILS